MPKPAADATKPLVSDKVWRKSFPYHGPRAAALGCGDGRRLPMEERLKASRLAAEQLDIPEERQRVAARMIAKESGWVENIPAPPPAAPGKFQMKQFDDEGNFTGYKEVTAPGQPVGKPVFNTPLTQEAIREKQANRILGKAGFFDKAVSDESGYVAMPQAMYELGRELREIGEKAYGPAVDTLKLIRNAVVPSVAVSGEIKDPIYEARGGRYFRPGETRRRYGRLHKAHQHVEYHGPSRPV